MPSETLSPEKEEAVGRVEGLLTSILGQLPQGQSALVPKLTREHLDLLFQIAKENNERESHRQRLFGSLSFVLAIATLVTVCFLCWLFLYFGQHQFIDKVITAVLGAMAGSGFSIGLLLGRRKTK